MQAAKGRLSAQLVLIRPDGSEGGAETISEGLTPIGRAQGSLFAHDHYLSQRHALLRLDATGAWVEPLPSLNGVFVRIFDEQELAQGDVFRIGQEILQLDLYAEPAPYEDGTYSLGSPNPGYWGRLSLLVAPGRYAGVFPLRSELTTLGRERGDVLFPEDGYVSGSHAKITLRDGRVFLTDNCSSNGTYVRIRVAQRLDSGAYVQMGQQLFRVLYSLS
jgi:pSer/pThr/pTyr-binding forkhead associated (FHA) protein